MTEQLKILLQAGTAVISDVCDSIGIAPPVLDTELFAVKGFGHGFAGPAYTIAGESQKWTGGDREKLAAIDAMPQGVVAVWAGGNIQGVCCFGDLLASSMQARGCAGAVVDGGVRDIAYLRTLSTPVIARYHTAAQGIGRWRVTGRQIPVRVRGAIESWITIQPGDFIVADDDGVIAIPQSLLDKMVSLVEEWSKSESSAREHVLQGMPLLTALEKYGHL
jgi:4-hydroxy-4-methyl-2-oxoglutarate aldolase